MSQQVRQVTAVVVSLDRHDAVDEIPERARQPQMREQHTELMVEPPLLQQVGHRPVETHRERCRVGRARTVGECDRQQGGEQRERQAQQARARARGRRVRTQRARTGCHPGRQPARHAGQIAPSGSRTHQRQCRQRQADEGHGGEFRADREPRGEPEAHRVAQPPAHQPQLQGIEREQAGGSRRHIEAGKGCVPENRRHRGEQQYAQERRALRCEQSPRPQPGGEQQQREERQHACPGKREVAPVVAAGVQDIDAFLRAVRRRGAERARPGEVRPEREQHAPERRMLGIVFVLAAVEQLDTGRQVLRLVPGVGIHAPAARRECACQEDDQRQCQPPRRGAAPAHRCAQTYAPNGCRSMMVCSRSGPVEIMSMGTPTRLCRRSR